MATDALYVNAGGDLVSWGLLDEAERAFCRDPPWVVAEYAMTLAEYVCWYGTEAALREL